MDSSERYSFDQKISCLQKNGFTVYYYHCGQLASYDLDIIDHLTLSTRTPTNEELSQILSAPVDEFVVIRQKYALLLSSDFDAVIDDTLSGIASLVSEEKIQSILIYSHKELPVFEINAFIRELPAVRYVSLRTKRDDRISDKNFTEIDIAHALLENTPPLEAVSGN